MIITTKIDGFSYLAWSPTRMKSTERGCGGANKLSSGILKEVVGNLKKLGLGFELD